MENDTKFDWKEKNIILYLQDEIKKYTLDETLWKNLISLLEYDKGVNGKFYQILQDSTIGLSDITDPTMTDFDKCLVAIKRIMLYLHVYASTGVDDEEKTFNEKVEDNFIDVIIQILNSNKLMVSKFLGGNNGAEILKDKHYRFDDIYNLFLNQSAFFESNEMNRKWNLCLLLKMHNQLSIKQ